MKTRQPAHFVLLFALLLSACTQTQPPTGTAPPPATATEPEAASPVAASPFPPTETPTATPEPLPCLEACEAINSENIGQLQQLARIGRGRITDLAVSPDGLTLAVAVGASVLLYDTQTLRAVNSVADGTVMESVSFSPDGKDLAIGSYYQVHIYNAEHAAEGLPLEKRAMVSGPFSLVTDVVYSLDGKTLGAVGDNRNAFLISPNPGEYKTLEHADSVYDLAFSPEGDRVAVSSRQAVYVWEVASGEQVQAIELPDCSFAVRLTSLPGTPSYVAACDAWLKVIENGAVTDSLETDGASVVTVAGDPGAGQMIAAGASDGGVAVWNRADLASAVWSAAGHAEPTHSLAYLPDGAALFSASNTEVRKWNAANGEELGTIDGFSSTIDAFAHSPDASLMYVSQDALWNLPTDACYGMLSDATEIKTFTTDLIGASVSPGGDFVLGFFQEKTGDTYTFKTGLFHADGSLVGEIPVLGKPGSAALSPDGKLLAAGEEQDIGLYTAEGVPSGKLVGHKDWVATVSFSPDGKQLVATTYSGEMIVWDVDSRSPLKTLAGPPTYATAMQWSADGTMLALGYNDGTVAVWDMVRFMILWTFMGHRKYISSLTFSPGGMLLVTGAADRVIKFWSLTTGEELYYLLLSGVAREMSFSGDGMRLVMALSDATFRMFGIPCALAEASVEFPKVSPGPLPTSTPEPVSAACTVVLKPPQGGKITYELAEGFHKFRMPPGSTPEPRKSILWSNMKRAEESGGWTTIWIPEGQATVEIDEATGSVTVKIPVCIPPPK